MRTLKKRGFVGPATAVSFFSAGPKFSERVVLLVGFGPRVAVYELGTGELVEEHEVLVGAVIHGIKRSYNDDTAVVFGQKQCKVFHASPPDASTFFQESSTAIFEEFRDLILDCQLIGSTAGNGKKEIAVGFSHNFVEIWTLGGEGKPPVCSHSVKCGDHSILYSLAFFGASRSTLVLAAGTVFNQILIWDPVSTDGVVRQRLKGHKGVIFKVDWNRDGTSLVSVSDDRTLRKWDLQDRGKSSLKAAVLSAASFKEQWAAFGHGARVWDCSFFSHGIITCGEDATCIVWGNDGSLKRKLEGHSVKNVWCVAVTWDGSCAASGGADASVKLWNVQRHVQSAEIGTHLKSSAGNDAAAEIDGMQCNLGSDEIFGRESRCQMRSLILSRSGSVFASSSAGHVNQLRSCPNGQFLPVPYFRENARKEKMSWCTLCLSHDESFIVAGSNRGKCRAFRTEADETEAAYVQWNAHETTCWRVFWGESRKRGEMLYEEPPCPVLLGRGKNTLLARECVISSSATGDLSIWHTVSDKRLLDSPRCVGRFCLQGKTCFSCAWFGSNGYMFCGDNRGNVYLTEASSIASENADDVVMSWSCVLKSAHGVSPVRWTGHLLGSFYSAGHDGAIVEYGLKCSDRGNATLNPIAVYKAGPITTVEALWGNSAMQSIIAVGAHAADLIVYDVTNGCVTFSIEIGGWRRPFDIFPSFHAGHGKAREASFTVSFTPPPKRVPVKGGNPNKKVRKQDTVCVCHFSDSERFPKYALQTNFHGRVSTSVKWLSPGDLAITCGEDGKIKLISCRKCNNTASFLGHNVWNGGGIDGGKWGVPTEHCPFTLECVKSLEMHRTSIRALKTVPSACAGHTLVISAGGNNIICCWRIETTIEADSSPSVALLSRKCYAADDGEHRFLSIAASVDCCGLEAQFIFAGNSQGHIYCFELQEEKSWDRSTTKGSQKKNYQSDEAMDTPVLYRLPQNIFHSNPRKDSPILSLGCLSSQAQGLTLLLSGGANGILTVWSVMDKPSFQYKPLYDSRLHQCGINCLDHSGTVGLDGCFTVVSGGDDTAFCISVLQVVETATDQDGKAHTVEVLQFVRTDSFCASALQGIRLVDNFLFCAGWNQRLHVLEVQPERGSVGICYIASCFLDVPDLSDIDVIRVQDGNGGNEDVEYRIVSVGQGIEVVSY